MKLSHARFTWCWPGVHEAKQPSQAPVQGHLVLLPLLLGPEHGLPMLSLGRRQSSAALLPVCCRSAVDTPPQQLLLHCAKALSYLMPYSLMAKVRNMANESSRHDASGPLLTKAGPSSLESSHALCS